MSLVSPTLPTLGKLLIANRGEIACRIIRSARKRGVHTVAVFSDADRESLHVKLADEAQYIGPSPAIQSYLNTSAILSAAIRAGAKSIHPGYGFLSESPDFAEACTKSGLIFVGPPAQAMRAVSSKSAAKDLMKRAGIPVVPGYHGIGQSTSDLAREAAKEAVKE